MPENQVGLAAEFLQIGDTLFEVMPERRIVLAEVDFVILGAKLRERDAASRL